MLIATVITPLRAFNDVVGANRIKLFWQNMASPFFFLAELKHLPTELVIHHRLSYVYVCQPKIPESLVSDSRCRVSRLKTRLGLDIEFENDPVSDSESNSRFSDIPDP